MQSFVDENGRPYIIMRGKRLFFFFLGLLCCFWFAFSALFTNARLCLSDGFSVFFRFFLLFFFFFWRSLVVSALMLSSARWSDVSSSNKQLLQRRRRSGCAAWLLTRSEEKTWSLIRSLRVSMWHRNDVAILATQHFLFFFFFFFFFFEHLFFSSVRAMSWLQLRFLTS